MDAKNISYGIVAFSLGLLISVSAIVVLAVTNNMDPVAIGALVTIANGCLVGLGSVMNPNKRFESSDPQQRPLKKQ